MAGDVYEREVQRRLADLMARAGVPGITQEVLYMLPHDFVKGYIALFGRALKEDAVSDISKRAGDEGVVAKVSSRYRGRKPMTTGGGKRFRTHWVVRDERALDVKRRLDRKLQRAMRSAQKELRDSQGMRETLQCGDCGADLDLMQELTQRRLVYCPFCRGTAVWKSAGDES